MNSTDSFVEHVLAAIQNVVGQGKVDLHAPKFLGNELAYLKDCIDSTFVSSVGAYVDEFELRLAKASGVKHAVAVVNGTSALHIALACLAEVRAGDEVLVPALTFVATANAVAYCGATPHFIDSSYETLGVDPHRLRKYLLGIARPTEGGCVNQYTGRRIRAIVPMHTFGHPVDMDALMDVATEFGLKVVEDAAEALGSKYRDGRSCGGLGHIGILSFNGNKIATTGGGGAILTNDTELALKAKHLTTTAKVKHPWKFHHDQVGYNYRLPNLNAALGCAQLENLPYFLEKKRSLYAAYKESFLKCSGFQLISEPEGCKSNYWLQAIILDEDKSDYQEKILELANQRGCMTRPIWDLMSSLDMYKNCPRMDLTVAESLSKRVINIPSSEYFS